MSMVKAYFVAQDGDTRHGLLIGRQAMSSLLGDIRDGKLAEGEVAFAEIKQALGFEGNDIDHICGAGDLAAKASMAIKTIGLSEIRFSFDDNGILVGGNKWTPLARGQARAVYRASENVPA